VLTRHKGHVATADASFVGGGGRKHSSCCCDDDHGGGKRKKNKGNNGFGNGGHDGVPGNSGKQDRTR